MRGAVRSPPEVLPSVGIREACLFKLLRAFRRKARVRPSGCGADTLFRIDKGGESSAHWFRAGGGILACRLRRRGNWLFRRRESVYLYKQIG